MEAQAKVDRGEMDYAHKSKMIEGILRKSELEGDVTGLIVAGQVSSRIERILTAREVINSMIDGAQKIIQELQWKLA